LLRAGAPLLVDIFPGEAGGGYHSDLTRTFCLGPAPDPLRKLYVDVHDAHRLAMDQLKVGEACRSYQERGCELFEKRGHTTPRTNETTQEGYVHGLGHGVGLAVHEAPRLGGPPSNTQRLEPGMVITVEPGLYYPSRGLGARIEDLVLVRNDGRFENLTPAPYDLVLQPRGLRAPTRWHGPRPAGAPCWSAMGNARREDRARTPRRPPTGFRPRSRSWRVSPRPRVRASAARCSSAAVRRAPRPSSGAASSRSSNSGSRRSTP